ncbi:MAG: hypothetical protein J6A22_02455 [Bacteroidales bacterium]|nr:hypothetical protein [Bacteroidales bacterium]
MKKGLLGIILYLLFFIPFSSHAQEDDFKVEDIPSYFMSGEYYLPIYLGELIQYQDSVTQSMLNVYRLLSHVMLGYKFPDGLVESTLTAIEQTFGKDHVLYGLALIPKAMDKEDDLDLLVNASEIIRKSEGEDSWEYAFALMHCANVTLDVNKYGTIDKSLGYIAKSLEILEKDYKDSWLYPVALSNRGYARLFNQDENFIEDVVLAFNTMNERAEVNPTVALCPLAYTAVFLSAISTYIKMPDKAIEVAEPIISAYQEFELENTENYLTLCSSLCYAYILKRDKNKARKYLAMAENSCAAIYGADSPKNRELDSYRKKLR